METTPFGTNSLRILGDVSPLARVRGGQSRASHAASRPRRRVSLVIGCLLTVGAMLTVSDGVRAWSNFNVYLWPNGRVPYRFANATDVDRFGQPAIPLVDTTKDLVRYEMSVWRAALTVADPAGGAATRYIRFVECPGDCENEENYILIRMNNTTRETNNMCSWRDANSGDWPGRHRDSGGVTELHFAPGQDGNTIRHELGHCLGLWHEFNRPDRDFWLKEQPDVDGLDAWKTTLGVSNVGGSAMPELGNYDYDSIMHYASTSNVDGACVTRWTDRKDNQFDRHGLDAAPVSKRPCRIFPIGAGAGTVVGNQVSARDKSRILQYYAREAQPNWGFFESLNTRPGRSDYDGLPNPYLPGRVSPVGTPAIAYQSPGNFDVFVRGSDEYLYWKSFRRTWLPFEPQPVDTVSAWTSLGWPVSSDPSAVSRALDRIDVVAVNSSGEVQRFKYVAGVWDGPLTIRGGFPSGGLKPTADGGYVGPAIASRRSGSLDVFVVRADGRLAVTTWSNSNWGRWSTLGEGYNVTARPAAVAVSSSAVRLALNESDVNVYEPLATFAFEPPAFLLGRSTAVTARQAPPAIAARTSTTSPYRVLIRTTGNRIAHKFGGGAWRDIGGIPSPGSGVSAVTTGPYSALIVMNGEKVTACVRTCLASQPNPGADIQAGGLWLRELR